MVEQTRWHCQNHPGTFVRPSIQKKGQHIGCWKCCKQSRLNTREHKRKIWCSKVIVCAVHSDRRCNKSRYVNRADRQCASCLSTHVNGHKRPAYKRHSVRWSRKRNDRERMARYAKQPGHRKSISEILRMRLGIR